MALLTETFASPTSRVTKTIVVVDLNGSTSMKEAQPEAQWLTTYGWFFDMLATAIASYKGRIVKHMGDGAMAVFSDDHPAEAINWAIAVQESMAEGRDKNRVSCDCSVGIAYGEVVEFDPEKVSSDSTDRRDYIGTVVDRAFRLSAAANAKAIFVDADTVTAAAMNKVKSKFGSNKSPVRKANDYQGQPGLVTLKGFSRAVVYHEILWEADRYSVNPDFVTKMAKDQIEPAPTGGASHGQALATGWIRGRVSSRNDKFGFIKSAGQEDHFFNSDHLFQRDLDVKVGDEVWFVSAPPLSGAKNPRAVDVVALGSRLVGRLEKIRPEKGFGFVTCVGQHGDVRQMFVFFGTDGGPWSNGLEVDFRIGENAKGLAGLDPRPIS
jgi:class 3 adenylate cyclase/cold shock CspA family protein